MARKPLVVFVIILALAVLACRAATGSGGSPDEAKISEEQISGEQTFRELGCAGCHDGMAGNIAPSLKGVYGNEVQLESGETVVADEDYLSESILSPNVKIVKGYQPMMPDFSNQISDDVLQALVEYIRGLSE